MHTKRTFRFPKWAKIAIPAFAITMAIIAVPSVAPVVASPSGNQTTSPTTEAIKFLSYRGITDPELTIKTVEDMSVLGNDGTRGYVNMLDSEDIIYLRPFSDPKAYASITKLYSATVNHEYAHILQKRLVESLSNGNEWERYSKLLELNSLLAQKAPALKETDNDHDVPFVGLETNADCIVASYSTASSYAYIDEDNGCNSYQMGEARAIIEGEWPSPENAAKWENLIQTKKAEIILMQKENAKKATEESREFKTSSKNK